MANVNKNTAKKGGLGRGLSELLSDNDELTNIENKVLLHRADGSSVKIYNKTGGAKSSDRSVEKSEFTANKNPNTCQNRNSSEIIPASKRANVDDRITIGKSREERMNESEGFFEHGKPHVVSNGASGEPIRIGGRPKPKREEPRIKIGGGKNAVFSKKGSVADELGKLDRYRPTKEDEFLADLLEIAEKSSSGDYKTDKNGRIIIEANKSKIKKK